MALSLIIDGKTVTAEGRQSLLDVARRAGAEIPSLCHHPLLPALGACRLCLVEVKKDGRKRITTSCNYEVIDGIEVRTETEEIMRHRKVVLELLLGLAPHSAKIKGLARLYGIDGPRFRPSPWPAGRENCILCGLCSRVCENVVGASAILMAGRGDRKRIDVPFIERVADSCIGCGACAAICPTEAIDYESIKRDILIKQPASKRPCRYAMMGLKPGALCPNNYDCAKCEVDQHFIEACRPDHPIFAARGLTIPVGWEE